MKPLSRRTLSRATLARQMLLAREPMKPLAAVERLAGLQAQVPRPPFVALWSRVDGFRREDLLDLIRKKKVVRAPLMRATIHLVSRRDYIRWRKVVQPALTRSGDWFARGLADRERVLAIAREHLDREPCTFENLRDHLSTLALGDEVRAAAYSVRMQLPIVQVPGEGEWGYPSNACFAVAESWLGEPLSQNDSPHDLFLRYLAAFGPASVKDFQTWSGLPKVDVTPIRKKLRTFVDERGRELFDLPKAPRPEEDTSAPVRFLPEYDNLLLAHADRSRIISDEHRKRIVSANLIVLAVFLVDGFVAGTWRYEKKKKGGEISIDPFVKLTKKDRIAIDEERERLRAFLDHEPPPTHKQSRAARNAP
jgi:hypothetical protein